MEYRITVYIYPGCGVCDRFRSDLESSGLTIKTRFVKVDKGNGKKEAKKLKIYSVPAYKIESDGDDIPVVFRLRASTFLTFLSDYKQLNKNLEQ